MAKILAVDDSVPMQQLVGQLLTAGGHDVILADNGVEGAKRFAAEKFDLVITDINMPAMNGFDLIRTIRGEDANIPILALTTEGEEEQRQKGMIAGVDGWIVKPFKPAQFLAIIRQVLS